MGSVDRLDAGVDFYDAGGNNNPLLDSELHRLRLSPEEKRDVIAFLLSLSS